MTFYDFKEIARKKPEEPFWVSRIFWRHITIPFSWICSGMNIKADHITLLSLISGMTNGLCYCWPTPKTYVLGTILIQGWWFLDHVDGELARYEIKHLKQRPSLAGQYLDLLVHRWVQPLYHVGMGVGLLRLTDGWQYVLLGWLAGANYFGFVRSQADSMVLRSLVAGETRPDNPAARELVDLGNAVPSVEGAMGTSVRRLINRAKGIKNWFSFPGCLVLLCLVTCVDALMLKMSFPVFIGIPWSATLVYLVLQALMALAQNVAGTWYVTGLLRKMP